MPNDSERENTPDAPELKLTPRDHELIVRQCELQHATSPKEIAGFTAAYTEAKQFASRSDLLSTLTSESLLELTMKLAGQTEPSNSEGYRSAPVRFANGNTGQSPDRVPQSMQGWAEAFVEERFDNPVDAYKEFEEIHPFVDGNGRVGHLLWAIDTVRRYNEWPQELPSDVFSKEQPPAEYKSAFGDVEPE